MTDQSGLKNELNTRMDSKRGKEVLQECITALTHAASRERTFAEAGAHGSPDLADYFDALATAVRRETELIERAELADTNPTRPERPHLISLTDGEIEEAMYGLEMFASFLERKAEPGREDQIKEIRTLHVRMEQCMMDGYRSVRGAALPPVGEFPIEDDT
jgi:hypothetical protein